MINPNETKSVFWLLIAVVVLLVVYIVYKNRNCCKCNKVPTKEETKAAFEEALEDVEQN